MYSRASGIKTLNGSNFYEWYEQIQFILGVMDLNLALLIEKPGKIIDANSTKDDVCVIKAWNRSNMLNLMLITMTVANNIKTITVQCMLDNVCVAWKVDLVAYI